MGVAVLAAWDMQFGGEGTWLDTGGGDGFSSSEVFLAGDLLKLGSDIVNGDKRKCESNGD